MNTSTYEQKIINILKKNKISFIREKQFIDLRNGKSRFDFYIPDRNCIIEVNGQQHYRFIRHFFKSREDFLKAQERDRRKISYCLAHKIEIYEIPYWDIDNINSANDIFSKEYLANSIYHNDDAWRKHEREN